VKRKRPVYRLDLRKQLKEIRAEAVTSARTLGFLGEVTFKKVEKRMFELQAAGPPLQPKTESEHLDYFITEVSPYTDLALLIWELDRIEADIEGMPRRAATIKRRATKLTSHISKRRMAAMDARL
jgi:hypothetical protein